MLYNKVGKIYYVKTIDLGSIPIKQIGTKLNCRSTIIKMIIKMCSLKNYIEDYDFVKH